MRRFISSLVVATFCVASSPAFAQVGAVKQGAKTVGTATKEAGQATVETTKSAAKATAKGTEKVAGKTKSVTETTYRCSDGTTDRTTLKANACKDHGGVRPAAPKH
jgi:hypothetical protein